MQEIQPNYVLSESGTSVTPADGDMVPRTFNDYEGALTVNLAKAFGLKGKTYQFAVDYKDQQTNLGSGLSPYTVNTFIGSVDFTVPVEGFDTVVLSGAFEQAISTGGEYTFTSQGQPNTLAAYQFYLDAPGQFAYTPLNITKTTWAAGLLYPMSKNVNFRCDYFYNYYTWTDVPSFNRVDEIVRFTYEAHF
jgi:predicted porin